MFSDEIASCEVSKSTIRFPLSAAIPVKLIGRIAKFRAKEVAERKKAKTAAPKKRNAPRQKPETRNQRGQALT